jgi:tRNA-splicing ligase RtcB (3'-phosphate/5'-hydroxy nucleic acid ligase)
MAPRRRGVAAPPPTPAPTPLRLVEETPFRWRIERTGPMRVPGVVFVTPALLPDAGADPALQQVVNVATLPGVVEASYGMPDIHWGFGFPIGGVAATDVEEGGVVSPGGVGFDISCGVRLLLSPFTRDELGPRLARFVDLLASTIPRGEGPGGVLKLRADDDLRALLARGARFAVENGFGGPRDLERCEDRGVMAGADPDQVSLHARQRGLTQVGSLGGGNHFLEVQEVEAVYDDVAAAAFDLHVGQVCVMIHCGSRGLGHQVCSDHVALMGPVMERYGIAVPDRQLACAPVRSPEGEAYLAAMAAAANFGRANRQLITIAARDMLRRVTGRGDLALLYDVSHNLARMERHDVDGVSRLLCVHRKGATPAFPPGHPDLAADLAGVGQPVLIPGSMGTASYVLRGVAGSPAFHSTCHGAGRTMSREHAKRLVHGTALLEQLEAAGIIVRPGSIRDLPEEAPFAYKDIDAVVAVCETAGLARRVARLVPLGVVKG